MGVNMVCYHLYQNRELYGEVIEILVWCHVWRLSVKLA